MSQRVRIPLAALAVAWTVASGVGARPATAAAMPAAAATPRGPRAQDDAENVAVELRVTSVGRDRHAVVDRGATDGLVVGDFVRFYPRGGGTYRAIVLRVEDRSAVVEIAHPTWTPEPGTKGGVQVPRARIEAMLAARRARQPTPTAPDVVPEPTDAPPAEDAPASADAGPDAPRWQNDDPDWNRGMPLLAEVGAVRPEDRAMGFGGRVALISDFLWASQDSRTDAFVRAGTDLHFDNPFGYGGQAHFDGEVNYRMTDVEDQVDVSKTRLRIDRASYTVGGTRFRRERWEGGRFLQHGVPEFGVLDGLEFSTRLSNGHRAGGSVGFMPEPDEDYATGSDFQLAGWYRWIADETERLTATAAYQKSFHHGDADRDLFVGKLAWLPERGWTLQGTVWVDLYTAGDDEKDGFLELTQAWIGARKSNLDGSGMGVTLTHVSFPEIDRWEFTPPLEDALADDRRDRLAWSGWWPLGQGLLLGTEVGVWNDEDETGGDLEVGLDIVDVLAERDTLGLLAFGADGAFSAIVGGRVTYALPVGEHSALELAYELANSDQYGFQDDNDDILMHWVHAGWNRYTVTGWDLSLNLDTRIWDEEFALSAGIYLTRSF